MAMENPPFEDVLPTENGDFPCLPEGNWLAIFLPST